MIVGGVIVVALAVVLAVSVLGGSSSKRSATSSVNTAGSTGKTHTSSHHKASSTSSKATRAANPADTTISVLNGTEKEGLAHRISTSLQQRGYSQAAALSGHPAGANQVTVVEYASGHRADAEGVARSLAVTQVQPIESAVASLAGSANVVVIVGADKAATVP